MAMIAEILARTPWWVWLLFLFLLWIGARALRPATMPFWRLAILPAVFLVWGLQGLVARYPLGWDVFFVGGDQVVGLPRTTVLEED